MSNYLITPSDQQASQAIKDVGLNNDSDRSQNPPVPSAKRGIVILGSSFRVLDHLLTLLCGSEPHEEASIRGIQQVSPGGSSNVECFSFPTVLANRENLDLLQTWSRSTPAKTVLVIIEEADLYPDNTSRLIRCILACTQENPEANVCLLLSKHLGLVHSRQLIASLMTVHNIFTACVDCSDTNNAPHFQALVSMNDPRGSSIVSLVPNSQSKVPTFHRDVYLIGKKSPYEVSPRESSTVLHPNSQIPPDLRKTGQTVLAQALSDSVSAKEYEEKIHQASFGVVAPYLEILNSERIRLHVQNNATFSSSESLLGKRSRSLTVNCNPRSYEAPILIQWRVKRTGTFSTLMGLRDTFSMTTLRPSTSAILENRYRCGSSEPFSVLFDGESKSSVVDLSRMAVDGVADALQRQVMIEKTPLEAPEEWHWEPQDQVLHMFHLLPESSRFLQIREWMSVSLPGVDVHEITQIQPSFQLLKFLHCRGRVQVSYPDTVLEEKLLFHGTGTRFPELVVQEGLSVHSTDPNPNDNWGSGIHMSEAAWYADERAHTYTDEDGKEHRQIFLTHAALGSSTSLPPDPTLRRPPIAKEINHMKIHHDSVTGNYSKDNANAVVHIVYEAERTCPAFLIDYSL